MVETVSSFRAAKTLNQRWGDNNMKEQQCIYENNLLQIMLQVNTSGEESKHCSVIQLLSQAHHFCKDVPV